ncbi:MAG: LPS O-antigen chain length determinant protein WzzB [Hydrogenovibrio sp.]
MQKQPAPSVNEMPYSADDEIDLFELWNGLMAEKWTIVASFVVVVALAAVYAFSAKPVYQSTAYLMQPISADVQELNRLNDQLGIGHSYTSVEVFGDYLDTLNSRGALMAFFKKNNLASVYDDGIEKLEGLEREEAFADAFQSFVEDFSVNIPKKQNAGEQVSVAMAFKLSNEEVRSLLKQYLSETEALTKQDLLEDLNAVKTAYVQRLEEQIKVARLIAKEQRMDRIARLQEAIDIAKALKIKEPKYSTENANVQVVQSQGLPLYYLGYRMLEAEQTSLKQRVSDDPFIGKLRGLQEKLSIAKSIDVSPHSFSVVKLDQLPSLGDKIKPKKALILAVAGVLGLMLGVFIALIRRAVKKRRAEMAVS